MSIGFKVMYKDWKVNIVYTEYQEATKKLMLNKLKKC